MTSPAPDAAPPATDGVVALDLSSSGQRSASAHDRVRAALTAPGLRALLLLVDGGSPSWSDETVVAVADASVPVVAVLHGRVEGRAAAVALAADLRVGSREVVLRVEPLVGGTSASLPRLVGGAVARRLLLDPADVDAEEALRLGLLDAVHDDPAAAARELAGRVTARAGLGAAVVRALATWERTGDVASALADEARLRAVVDLHD
ncbi:MAG: enoyl-CoA hydratase-related protein [Propionibacteriales bacterium]|nr:enoyl-CoA hydratase-related protein [Propionibacteriales bacterium]